MQGFDGEKGGRYAGDYLAMNYTILLEPKQSKPSHMHATRRVALVTQEILTSPNETRFDRMRIDKL